MIWGRDFVFVLNPKCASTSIARALVPEYGCRCGETHAPLRSDVPVQPIIACVVRDDIDRLRSAWREATPSFEAWRRKEQGEAWLAFGKQDIRDLPQSLWLRHVNFILKFENLAADWARFCDAAKIKAKLPHINKAREMS